MKYHPEFFKKIDEEGGYENFVFWYNLVRACRLPNHKTNRILILRPDAIGDFILFSPVLDGIRKKYKGKRIFLLVMEAVAPLAQTSGLVDEIIVWKREAYERRGRYWKIFLKRLSKLNVDVVIYPCLSREANIDEMIAVIPAFTKIGIRSDDCNISSQIARYNERLYTDILEIDYLNKHESEINRQIAEKLGVEVGNPLRLWDSNAIIKLYPMLQRLEDKKIAVIAPGTRQTFKSWPKKKFLEVLRIIKEYFFVFIVGDNFDKYVANWLYFNAKESSSILVACGKFSFAETSYLMSRASFFIGNDSSLAHVGVMLGVKGHVIVGGGHFGRFFPYPYDVSVKVHTYKLSCFGCNWKCYDNSFKCVRKVTIPEHDLIF